MNEHKPFRFADKDQLLDTAARLNVSLPFEEDIPVLFEPIEIGGKSLVNRFAVLPMEGFDATADGSPGELTLRRYLRYAGGGSALIWFEATSILLEGRSNPHQLLLNKKTLDGFKRLVETTRREAMRVLGSGQNLFLVLQLTHSGRFSKPNGMPRPLVAVKKPSLDINLPPVRIVSDDELDRMLDTVTVAASLARQADFDAVDIKACHGYLAHDLLSAFDRADSRYGGDFTGRVRWIEEAVKRIRDREPRLGVTARLNVFDGLRPPEGWGTSAGDALQPDMAEPTALIGRLIDLGCGFMNITAGIPYLNPHLGRPFDRPVSGGEKPPEHPLAGVARLIGLGGRLQKKYPMIPFIGTGYSWLRCFFPQVAAAVIGSGGAGLVGLGRSSFAYPDAPRDLMENGALDSKKLCTSCSRCTELMRAGGPTGCAVRDEYFRGRSDPHGDV
ncbi:MAG: hypothetical protein MUP70_17065 [Candidatus Aminicenantes bacterium]|nr:hypothetical protein [Candidatus Aminicenantes bacterium]